MSKTKKLSEKLRQLDELISWFEQPDLDLDAAVEKFSELELQAADIKQDLAVLENKITILKNTYREES